MKKYRFNGYSVEYHESIDSTNTRAKLLASEGAPRGTVVIASSQSAGRGRTGRSFFSPDGGVYMSVIFRPSLSCANVGAITPFAAVCVCEAIRELFCLDAKIKWVNDVLIDGRKVCGILTESSVAENGSSLEYVVVGIGINLARADFPSELSDIACSISDHSEKPIGKRTLIANILDRLAPLLDGAVPDGVMDAYRSLSCTLGERVYTLSSPSICGIAEDIDDGGGLIIRTDCGERVTVSAGEISIRKEK